MLGDLIYEWVVLQGVAQRPDHVPQMGGRKGALPPALGRQRQQDAEAQLQRFEGVKVQGREQCRPRFGGRDGLGGDRIRHPELRGVGYDCPQLYNIRTLLSPFSPAALRRNYFWDM
jgi:hypothetical protein